MIKKFLKLMGVGLVSGAACRMGGMLADALFPGGLRRFLSKFNKQKDTNVSPPKKKKYLQLCERD